MATLWDDAARRQLLERFGRLTAGRKPLWGKMNAAQMLAHLNDTHHMAAGDLKAKVERLPIRFFPLKQLIIYVLPFPKSSPTSPELIARLDRAQWDAEVAAFPEVLGRLARIPATAAWPIHPAFGRLSPGAWGVLMHKHVSHHFAQFGV